jgi:hypothetical protein
LVFLPEAEGPRALAAACDAGEAKDAVGGGGGKNPSAVDEEEDGATSMAAERRLRILPRVLPGARGEITAGENRIETSSFPFMIMAPCIMVGAVCFFFVRFAGRRIWGRSRKNSTANPDDGLARVTYLPELLGNIWIPLDPSESISRPA